MVSIVYPYTMDTTVSVSDTVTDTDTVSDNSDVDIISDKKSGSTAKASKHKYGKYKNVLLKDEELQKLQTEYDNWEELIDFLDEYIEMKGYKAKSHYLCIKRWVVDAVKQEKIKRGKLEQTVETEDRWQKFMTEHEGGSNDD